MNQIQLTSFPKKSGIFTGTIFHKRFAPKFHQFNYPFYMFWLDLDDLEQPHFIDQHLRTFSWLNHFSYHRNDYFNEGNLNHKQQIIDTAKQQQPDLVIDKVYLLGHIRSFGFYFSPVNFYFLIHCNEIVAIVAEVSNTPWNEKHLYLIDIEHNQPTPKDFHVSPFMNLNMKYFWQINLQQDIVNIKIENKNDSKLFEAGFAFEYQELTATNLKNIFWNWPIAGFSMLKKIYWQAFKLFFLKRIPFHDHPRGSYGKHT